MYINIKYCVHHIQQCVSSVLYIHWYVYLYNIVHWYHSMCCVKFLQHFCIWSTTCKERMWWYYSPHYYLVCLVCIIVSTLSSFAFYYIHLSSNLQYRQIRRTVLCYVIWCCIEAKFLNRYTVISYYVLVCLLSFLCVAPAEPYITPPPPPLPPHPPAPIADRPSDLEAWIPLYQCSLSRFAKPSARNPKPYTPILPW